MVIGNGLVAQRFEAYMENESFIIFASGVSDSKNADAVDFKREEALIHKCLSNQGQAQFVYFSTCSIYDSTLSNEPYILHKLRMEQEIINATSNHLIFRVSNLVGKGGNPKTLINFFVNKIKDGNPFEVWKQSYRNVVDIDHAYLLMDYCLQRGHNPGRVNIANPINFSVAEIVCAIERSLKIKGNYTLVERGEQYPIDIRFIKSLDTFESIPWGTNYINNLLHKYYL